MAAEQVMDDENGDILHQQRVHDSALVKMEARVHGMGMQPQEVAEDVTLTFANAVARISSLEVCGSSDPGVLQLVLQIGKVSGVGMPSWELAKTLPLLCCHPCLVLRRAADLIMLSFSPKGRWHATPGACKNAARSFIGTHL